MRHSKLVGTVSNCTVSTYHGPHAVRLKTAPTGGESVHLLLESTINAPISHQLSIDYLTYMLGLTQQA